MPPKGQLPRRLLLALLACGVAASVAAQPAAPRTTARELVAVLEFEGLGATKQQVSTVTDRLRELLLESGRFRLVDRAQMDKVLEEQALQQAGCTTQECAVQVGKVLGVRTLITGKLTQVDGSLWVLSATLVDVETAETLRAVSVQQDGNFRAVLTSGTQALSVKLLNAGGEPAVPPAEPPPPPPAPLPPPAEPEPYTPPASGPRRGFSAFAGASRHSGTFSFHAASGQSGKSEDKTVVVEGKQSLTTPTSGTGDMVSSGLTVGGDYQWVLPSSLSISAFIVTGTEAVQGDLARTYESSGHTLVGGHGRLWWGNLYAGIQVGVYSVSLTPVADLKTQLNVQSLSGTGAAVAATAGWESPAGLLLGVQIERGTVAFDNADYIETGVRLHLGYRFGGR
jgi:hypothetical protein